MQNERSVVFKGPCSFALVCPLSSCCIISELSSVSDCSTFTQPESITCFLFHHVFNTITLSLCVTSSCKSLLIRKKKQLTHVHTRTHAHRHTGTASLTAHLANLDRSVHLFSRLCWTPFYISSVLLGLIVYQKISELVYQINGYHIVGR